MDIDVEVDEELRKFIEPQIKNFSAAKQLSDTGFEHQVKIIQEAIKKHPLAKQFIKNYPTTMEEEIKDLPLEINKALREQNLKKLLDETSVKAPVYRTSTSRVNLTQESRFLNTTELGVHVGTSGQGDSLLAKKMLYENKNSSPEDTLKYTILKHGGENTVIDPITTPANISAIKSKYYLNIKNPLIFPYEEPSSWSAHEILVEPATLKTFEDVIRKNLKIKKGATYNTTQAKELKRLRKQAIDLTNYRQRFIDRTSIPAQNPDQRLRGRVKYKVVEDFAMWQLNLDFQKWLKSFGFDSIKYVNGVEPSYASDVDHLIDIDELHKQFKPTPFEQKQHLLDFDEPRHWSYIVFDPEQLKTTTAAKFDPKDPRHAYASGGNMFRLDGTRKDEHGFLGPIKNSRGEIMTEFSTTIEMDGKKFLIPTLVPGQTEEALEYMRNMEGGQGFNTKIPIEKQIVDTAAEHAMPFIKAGLSPFYKHGKENRKQNTKGGKLTARGIRHYA